MKCVRFNQWFGGLWMGCVLSVLPPVAQASGCNQQASVSLTANARQEVDNDQVRLQWQTQAEGKQAREAMAIANKTIALAIEKLKGNTAVRALRNNIQTYPRYGKEGSIVGWQAQGSLSFEMDVQALQAQGGFDLPPALVLGPMDYFVGQASQTKVRKQLLDEAMRTFKAKAEQVAKGFGRNGYTLSELVVNDEVSSGPSPMFARAMVAESSAKFAEVPSAAGNSQVQVGVSGQVCLP